MNDHLTRQQMLSFLDGELPRLETRRVEVHLHSCWTCRSAAERLKGDIGTILDALNEQFSPALPPPPLPWPSFHSLLARSVPPLSARSRIAAYMSSLLSPVRVLVVTSIAALLLISTYSIFRSKPVSAQEVLQRVRLADLKRNVIAKDQVLRERVRIRRRSRNGGYQKTGRVDAWMSPTAAYWNMADDNDAVAADLAAEYRAHDIPLALPLSAASVDSWGTTAGGNPTLSKLGTDVDLSFASAHEPVKRVSLLIQPETWQVKQMTLDLPDASFEVTEEDFSVVPINSVPSELLAHLEPGPRLAAKAVIHPFPTVNLDRAELDVFATLHHLKADLGEPVTVTRSNREVQVGVWRLPAERQKELNEALAGKPGVQVAFTPVRSASENGFTSKTAAPAPPANIMTEAAPSERGDSRNGERRLLQFFGSAEKEQEFTSRTLARSTALLSHLYALRILQGQFPPERERALTSPDHARLSALVQDHANAVESNLDALKMQLAPLNAEFNVTPSSSPANQLTSNWQSSSLDALERARVSDRLLRALLTTNESPVSPESALPQLDQNLTSLSAALKGLTATSN